MAKEVDGFIFHVKILEIPAIQITDETDNLTVAPGDTINYQFIYQGGIGGGRSTGFNIFVYDRSDTTDGNTPAGTPDAPSASTTQNRSLLLTITPSSPLKGRPEIPQTLIDNAVDGLITTNNLYATLTSGVWISWHRGSFEVVTPSTGYDGCRSLRLWERHKSYILISQRRRVIGDVRQCQTFQIIIRCMFSITRTPILM